MIANSLLRLPMHLGLNKKNVRIITDKINEFYKKL